MPPAMPYLSQYVLSLPEARRLRLTDTYSLHRVVYGLFPDTRDGNRQAHSGILYADKGGRGNRRLLILSDRAPLPPDIGRLESKTVPDSYLRAPAYRFEVVVNPVQRNHQSHKLLPVCGREAVAAWFCRKAPQWGFAVRTEQLLVADCTVDTFQKKEYDAKLHKTTLCTVTLNKATLTGVLDVADPQAFATSVLHGIGRARAFGCGLLQIVPCA